MRFPAELVHRIRSGEITATVRRYEGSTSLKVGAIRAIQRVEDVRVEHEDGTVHYERQVTTIDTAIEILARYSRLDADGRGFEEPQLRALRHEGQPVPELAPAILDQLPERLVTATGFNAPDDLVDFFRAEFGGPAYQRVWIFEFGVAHARPLYLAQQNGLASPPQYTSNQARAIDDLEVLDPETLTHYAKRGRARHARYKKKELEADLKSCATPEQRQRLLIERAREAGVDVRNELRSLERRLIQKIEKSAA